MDDLISRQAALRTDCFGDGHNGLRAFHVYEDYLKMRKYLESLPPAQPEIIYCVGCKYMHTEETGFWCAQTGKEVRLDHYCGYAERKEKTNEVNH